MKEIPGYPRYFLTDEAEVISFCGRSPRTLKKSLHKGYYKVALQRGDRAYTKYIHQLMLITYVGECPEGMEVCHNDGDRTNNRLDNLRYGTRSENILDSVKHGTHARARLTKEDKENIRELYQKTDISQEAIGKMFNVSQVCISRVIKG